jgi:hypothetical protein
MTEGLYIDDPFNPVLARAKALAASATAAAALVYSTLA